MKQGMRLAVLFAVILSVLPGAFVTAGAAHAAGEAATARAPRVVQVTTQQWSQQAQLASLPQASQTTQATAQPGGNLAYYGGHVQHNPVAYLIFWGAHWGTASALSADAQVAKNYFSDVGATAFERVLTQYSDGSGSINNVSKLGGVYVDATAPATDTSCGGATVQDSSIQAEVSHAIAAAGWLTDSTNATYFVFTPPSEYVNDGASHCSDQPQSASFCAYHKWSVSANLAYAAIAYPLDVGCQVSTSPNNNVMGDSLANVSSYTQFDAITDPVPGSSWMDSLSQEIGDKCAWDFSANPTHLNNGGVFELQAEYSDETGQCINAYASHLLIQPNPAVQLMAPTGTDAPAQTVTLYNTGNAPASWSVASGSLPSWVTVSPSSGSLSPGATQSLTISFHTASYSTEQTLSTRLSLTDPFADDSGYSIPITVVLANLSKQWYFAEGYTGSGFDEYLSVANPNSQWAHITVTYRLSSGSPIVKTYSIAPNTRFTRNVRDDVGAHNVSMSVTSDQPVVAERPMYFTFAGIQGGSDVLGATSLSASAYNFGYLSTQANYYTYLTVLNTNATPMYANVTYYSQGGAIYHQQLAVPANSRGTIDVNHLATSTTGHPLPAGVYSARVVLTSDQAGTTPTTGGLVERPMYFINATTHYNGSADVVGVAQPLTRWDFAEGFTGANGAPFHEWYALSNPGGSATATATLTLYKIDGTTATATVSVAPNTLQMVDVNNILGAGQSNSAEVTASQPILAERVMSFDYNGDPGASDVLGAAAPGQLFAFAEGYTGPGFTEYLTIENPNPTQTATVTINFLPTGGSAVQRIYSIPPHSRFTLNVAEVMPNLSLSVVVLANVPIVAERPEYFNYAGRDRGGHDVVGYQP